MSEIIYLTRWKPELCIQLDMENKRNADFNRLLFKAIPSTEQLQKGANFEDAKREEWIFQLKEGFNERLEEGESHSSLYNLYINTFRYLKWCDKKDIPAFTQSSLESYMSHLDLRVMQGEIKNATYKSFRGELFRLFTQYLELPISYFNNVTLRDRCDVESFEAYSRSDLNQLLPFLRQLFKQTYTQFIADPEAHINATKNTATMSFDWQSQQYALPNGITKMMCAGTFLLSYYTHANTTDLFNLKQPNNASMTMGEVWYTMPAFKRRAFKTIQVEMGSHELEIPKYAFDFFDKLLNASRLINNNENARLLQAVTSNKSAPMKTAFLQRFLKLWVEKHFNFTDQTGRRLRPVISRFRETGAQLTAYHQGDLANNIMLNNTPSTRKKNYSAGNKIVNNGMMQDTLSIREEEIKSKVSTKQAKENLNIEVLVIEAAHKIYIPNLTRTLNGGSCDSPFGEKSEKYTKKARSQGLLKEGERLACADLLGCFGCPHQVIVQTVPDIWCLLSFKACIEESLYLHLDASHYRQNFENVIHFIDQKILPRIEQKILKQAQTKLDDDGFHPAWDDSESILALFPRPTSEAK